MEMTYTEVSDRAFVVGGCSSLKPSKLGS
ncbi:TPA: hypothetical protein N0F65_005323 [Lagenidium giganteum]|uniref:Uncharacterized protein n=1 Tax=Lagenidium giganteum TaxID=4803 RepID=A0AAV2YV48_9STRA|nr:TPA: hypothetical protein N0F65_005323 [Lagenidium giganteum]